VSFSIPHKPSLANIGILAYLDKVLHYGLLAVAFSLPFVRLNHLNEYLFLSLLIVWLGRKLFTGSLDFEKTALGLPIFLFLGWVLLTVPFATDWFYSLGEWQKSIPRFLMFWFVVNVVKTERDIRGILHSFSIGLVLLAILRIGTFFLARGRPLLDEDAGWRTNREQSMAQLLLSHRYSSPLAWFLL
jgi:hypothetical protein